MIILDPFYGVSETGDFAARMMNRLLILLEVAVAVALVLYQLSTEAFGWWFWIALPLGMRLGVKILHNALRFLWNLLLVLAYGTTDIGGRSAKTSRRKESFVWTRENPGPDGVTVERPLSGMSASRHDRIVNEGRRAFHDL